MRILFIHQNFPGQYRHLAPALAARGDEVVGLGQSPASALPGVRHLRYNPPAIGRKETHRYIRGLETAIFRGQQLVRAVLQLKSKGWQPDLVCCHPGWGEGLFLRDALPSSKLLYYYEYYLLSVL